MTIHEAQQQLLFQLYHLYDNREAANIADWVMEHITGWKKIDRIINKQVPLLPHRIEQLQQYTRELLEHKPVQYVLHEAWFCGMPFYVDEHVLIPRPETEELVEWIVREIGSLKSEAGSPKSEVGCQKLEADSDIRLQTSDFKLLDIGTGSGCIPIALKKKLPGVQVYSCDVSEGALAVAQKNATALQAEIHLLQADFLNRDSWQQLPKADIIVSNPPYIPQSDEQTMQPNVLKYEPHVALFVPNNDALLFYKAIAEFAQQKLQSGGSIYVEIHEDLGEQTKALFLSKGFTSVEIKKDMQGKDRMVKAWGNEK
jgi:release factor glutamine methyltransferase